MALLAQLMAAWPWLLLVAVAAAALFSAVLARRATASVSVRKRVEATEHPYGIAESVGRRSYMEDRHVVARLAGADLYGVFDGHAGAAAAQFCSTQLEAALTSDSAWPAAPADALTGAFLRLDARFLEVALAEQPPLEDGTTALAAAVVGSRVWVANAGDSRALLIQRGGRSCPLSDDHKPNRPDEIARIKALGGSVYFHGVWRVGGVLAVSRAIGDRSLKPLVTALPEVLAWDIGPHDAAIVLATDGLWDVMSNSAVAATTLAAMAAADAAAAAGGGGSGGGSEDAFSDPAPSQRAASTLVRDAILGGSSDNVTALVIDLRGHTARLLRRQHAAAAPAAVGAGAGVAGGGSVGSRASSPPAAAAEAALPLASPPGAAAASPAASLLPGGAEWRVAGTHED